MNDTERIVLMLAIATLPLLFVIFRLVKCIDNMAATNRNHNIPFAQLDTKEDPADWWKNGKKNPYRDED